jgi:hypothetical protein
MTIKELCRSRNKLVMLSFKLKGEEQKAVDFSIQLIDLYLDGKLKQYDTNVLKTIIKELN